MFLLKKINFLIKNKSGIILPNYFSTSTKNNNMVDSSAEAKYISNIIELGIFKDLIVEDSKVSTDIN